MKFFAFLALLCLATPAAAEPSFDCAKAATDAERTICDDQNPDLALRDAVLSRLFDALGEAGEPADVLAGQPAWRRERDRCGSDAACLRRSYDARISVLARAAGDSAGITGNYGYQLSAETDFGTAYFVREADGTLSGSVSTVTGPAFHTCSVTFDGANPIGDAFIWDDPAAPAESDDFCRILFRPDKVSLRVDSSDCQTYCGANGAFDATYAKLK